MTTTLPIIIQSELFELRATQEKLILYYKSSENREIAFLACWSILENRTIDSRVNDLDELCKDWVFFRAQIFKYCDSGDEEAAEKSRKSFKQIYVWLCDYNEADVSNTWGK